MIVISFCLLICFAELGHQVCCMDINPEKIQQLRQGQLPIYEPGLKELLEKNCSAAQLVFTDDIAEAVEAELDKIAAAQDRIDMIAQHFGSEDQMPLFS